ncbi:PP2C family serine/threonine-protein phosphatase [Actinomyces slackii]|uniref:PP2C-family Ser/Thr phosphatase n=1 Tax=Actinomyces slackii TaxID=52774 RepID=A0A448KAK8_9ACTO|nr:PP2C family serine/threonine-protein phosphatase [Actinomyces slackii]VEG73957.1 PP2C-family Ser/Thr phosphatase [Actinomyces slackii]
MTISLRFAARSDVGLVRQSNQDAGYAGPHLCILCDGMGGPAGGDIASAVAVEHLMPLDADSHQAGELLGLMREAVQAAHGELVSLSAQDPELAGLGTTCIAVMRSGNKLAMVHVGDSRAYMLRDGTLTQVTTDHTFVEYLVETGRLTRDQARQHPQRSVLLRVLGDAEGDVQLDESIREAVPGDRWLLCSDGLSGPVTAETIGEVLATVPDPGQAADQLIDLALRAGGPDNVTAVVFDVVSDDPETGTDPQVVGSAATERLARERAAAAARSQQRSAARSADEESQPSTPAAKAAALMATLDDKGESPRSEVDEAIAAEAQAQATARRKNRKRAVFGFVLLLVALVGAGALFYSWTQTNYYVASHNGQVAIYRGIPQSLGPVKLSHVVQVYDKPAVKDLDQPMQSRLEEGVHYNSLEAARKYVESTVTARAEPEAPPSPSGSPSAPPSGSASPGASPSSSASPTATGSPSAGSASPKPSASTTQGP